MYGIHMHLDFFNITINDGLEYMIIIININTQKKNILYVCTKLIHIWCLHFQTIFNP
jgi:hypothetical protein